MALSGDHVIVKVDSNTIANGDIRSVDLGLAYDQFDVTGFGDDVHQFINGQLNAPVTIQGYLTTTATIGTHTLFNGALASGSTIALEVQIGNNATPTTGDPKYTGNFIVESYRPSITNGGAIMFTATLKPATGTAPAWGTV